jgi:hypothetical protein
MSFAKYEKQLKQDKIFGISLGAFMIIGLIVVWQRHRIMKLLRGA